MSSAHSWKAITDLPDDWESMTDPTLPVLADEWREGRERVGNSDEIKRFNAELLREVAIETGLIEGLYSIDRGTTETLIRIGLIKEELAQGIIDRSPDEIMPILEDQQSATEGLFDFVKRKRDLTTSYIKELHAHLTRHQPTTVGVTDEGSRIEIPLLRGEWKQQSNNPRRPDGSMHEYCPPEHVAAEMDRLIEMHAAHEASGVSPDVAAAWLHHRFAQIHPFQDGNGRVARSLASLVFLRAGWFLVSITRDERANYIETLEAADDGELRPLVKLFVGRQQQAFDQAITALSKAEASTLSPDEIRRLLSDRLRERKGLRSDVQNWNLIDSIFINIKSSIENFSIGVGFVFISERENKPVLFEDGLVKGEFKITVIVRRNDDSKLFVLGGIYFDDEVGDYGAIIPYTHQKGKNRRYSESAFVLDAQYDPATLDEWLYRTLKWFFLEWERRR